MANESVTQRHQAALRSLHPVFRWRVERVLRDLESSGWKPVLRWGKRSAEKQKELVAKGYGASFSWHVPGSAKLIPDGHGLDVKNGEAADIIDRRWGWSGPCASKSHPFWTALGQAAKRHGLEWGGDWAKMDVAHVQMKLVDMPRIDTVVV